MKTADYKNIEIKKIAKEEIETHLGLLGDSYASLRYIGYMTNVKSLLKLLF